MAAAHLCVSAECYAESSDGFTGSRNRIDRPARGRPPRAPGIPVAAPAGAENPAVAGGDGGSAGSAVRRASAGRVVVRALSRAGAREPAHRRSGQCHRNLAWEGIVCASRSALGPYRYGFSPGDTDRSRPAGIAFVRSGRLRQRRGRGGDAGDGGCDATCGTGDRVRGSVRGQCRRRRRRRSARRAASLS